MRRQIILSCLLAGATLATAPSHADPVQNSAQTQVQTIDDVISVIADNYIYPDRVALIRNTLHERQKAGEYNAAATPQELASMLSRDIVDITGDDHFIVGFNPSFQEAAPFDLDDEQLARSDNFGFNHTAILPGNIGYIRLKHFAEPQMAFTTATAAMNFVQNSEALIIDLRNSRGGHNAMAQLLSSYLFSNREDQLLATYYTVENGKKIEGSHWVLPGLPGKRMPDTPVYILTSSTTFSAGEWMAFSLAELGRVTIVGEVTAGAAHSVGRMRVNDQFFAQIPTGKTSGPVSGGDFQGIGVKPDHAVPAQHALNTAHMLALEEIARSEEPGNAEWHLVAINAALSPQGDHSSDIRDVPGTYENFTITNEEGLLVYRWRERLNAFLIPLGNGVFGIDGDDTYRFRLIRNNGTVTGIRREFKGGGGKDYERTD